MALIDGNCATSVPAALHGCGTGGDGAPYRSPGMLGTVPAVEFGIGYGTGAMQLEALFGYRSEFQFDGRANFPAPERVGKTYRQYCRPCPDC